MTPTSIYGGWALGRSTTKSTWPLPGTGRRCSSTAAHNCSWSCGESRRFAFRSLRPAPQRWHPRAQPPPGRALYVSVANNCLCFALLVGQAQGWPQPHRQLHLRHRRVGCLRRRGWPEAVPAAVSATHPLLAVLLILFSQCYSSSSRSSRSPQAHCSSGSFRVLRLSLSAIFHR